MWNDEHERYVEHGYLSKATYGDLVLYNYTDQCTYDRFWNEITLNARGTVYEASTGKVVARAFPKFFNLNETEDTQEDKLPWHLPYEVFNKMDGSLGIIFCHKDVWHICTRGSFQSEQAKIALGIFLSKKFGPNLNKESTYLVEIIYPENRIVVNYGDKKELVLLAAYHTESGIEYSYQHLIEIANHSGMSLVGFRNLSLKRLKNLAKTENWMTEGWVVKFFDGRRVKIKTEDYVRLHRAMTNLTPLSVWEALHEKRYVNYVVQIPEEFRATAEEYEKELSKQFHLINHIANNFLNLLTTDKPDQKDFAMRVQKVVPKFLQSVVFSKRIGKDPGEQMWKIVRPDGNIFKKDLMEQALLPGGKW